MSLARTQEYTCGWGRVKQTDIATANLLAGIWRLSKLNAWAQKKLNVEGDADYLGKSHEFQTESAPVSWDCTGSIEKHLTSEIAAWAFAFGLGTVTESPAGTYTCVPLVSATSGYELPYFSFLQAVRQGASVVEDEMMVGCAVNDFLISVGYGPGRANSKITINFVGSGKLVEPSAITIPAATAEHLLPSSSLAFTLISIDYVSLKRIVSLEFGWNNNIMTDFGFYPGSGAQATVGGAIRGRLLCGKRQPILKYVALVENGSTEWTKLKASTTGTAVITATNTAAETFTATYQQVKITVADHADAEGFVAVTVETIPEYHSSNAVLSVVAKTAVTGIGQ